ncbi:TIGR01777 family oxidoreductase [Marinobacter sp. 2_MG-2023]|uniref:TIGR01777 family oxidoreductase n=1 Tax=Marinobacter sp. 2_MG-2023 TaxID=3062679 RepID=UPI0026E3D95A|nr:TIGR01777 family oxidoreductase [Marinobacter sp. 2_MG-2023]MDO6442147.1 TIGR01777 family oxidoreductase [Marinobacter sp. 2_MG-2023]
MEKRVLITGGTGFIGHVLCHELLKRGYRLTVLSRQAADNVRAVCGQVEVIADLESLRSHPGYDAVINLAGEGIADKRWSDQRKKALRDSRISLTATLTEVITSWEKPPEVMISGSAVGFYGDQGSTRVTEETAPHDEFTHRLCKDWEDAALALETLQVRVCLSRTGVVAGAGGGFLQRMILPFKLGLGGRLGDGQQYMPWIHRSDVVAALIWMLETPEASGAYNVVSPNPVTNREFTRCLATTLKRPAIFPAPAPVLNLALGEMSRLLLTGQQAVPERLTNGGFVFQYPRLEKALEDVVN